jgi:hypothetical protein
MQVPVPLGFVAFNSLVSETLQQGSVLGLALLKLPKQFFNELRTADARARLAELFHD